MELLIKCLITRPKIINDRKAREKLNDMKTPKTLVWTMPNGNKREVKTGDVLINANGKTFYVTDWNEVTGVVNGVSTCEKHYFVRQKVKDINCQFTEV